MRWGVSWHRKGGQLFLSEAAGAQFWLVRAIQLVADLATFMSRILFHASLIAWHQATYTSLQTNCKDQSQT